MSALAPRFSDSFEELLNDAVRRGIAAAANSVIPPKKYVTNIEAAARLDITPDTLSLWRHEGKGPVHVGSGKLVRYAVVAVDAWLAAMPTVAPKGAVTE